VVDYSGVFLPKGDYQEFYAPITKTDSALIAAVGEVVIDDVDYNNK